MSSPRTAAIAAAAAWFDSGAMLAELKRRVAFRTESQDPARAAALASYLTEEIGPSVARCGFEWAIWPNPVPGAPPLLFAERREDDALPTVLIYGHGDVVAGYDEQWSDGRSPWELSVADGRWYGRGTADNKGQHTINLAALGADPGQSRPARLQRQVAARNGRGDRVAGPAPDLRAARRMRCPPMC